MLRFIKRAIAPVALLAMSACVPAAKADVVKYYVTGTFGVDTATVGANDLQSDSISSGSSTITFYNSGTGASGTTGDHTVVTFGLPPTSGANFGDFVINNTSSSGTTDNFSTGFTLNVFQLIPGSGSGSLVGTISGQVSGSVSQIGTSISVTFSPSNTLLLPPSAPTELYVIDNISKLNGGAPNSDTTLNGTITSVPLPATASTGFVMLGGLGLLTGAAALRRRRQMA